MTVNTTKPLTELGFSEELGRWRMVCGDWRDDLVAVHGPNGHIASGLTELQARALIDAHNCTATLRGLIGAMANDLDRLALRMSHLEELLADQQAAERRSLTNTQKDAELLAWVFACPEMAAEALNDAAAGEGTPRGNLERRMTLYNTATMAGEN